MRWPADTACSPFTHLTIIQTAVDRVRADHDPDFDISRTDLADPLTYPLLSRGDTDGVFQVGQSQGMTALVVKIQPREFRVLEYLMRHEGQVVTRTMLLENVWDYHFDPQTNVIDVHISRLRGKIDKGFDKPLLHTVRGAGYRLST